MHCNECVQFYSWKFRLSDVLDYEEDAEIPTLNELMVYYTLSSKNLNKEPPWPAFTYLLLSYPSPLRSLLFMI